MHSLLFTDFRISGSSVIESSRYQKVALLPNLLPVARTKQSAVNPKPLPLSEPTDTDLSAAENGSLSKDLRFFRDKNSNVVNFDYEADGIWRVAFRGSEILSWKETNGKKAVSNVFIIGQLGQVKLGSSASEYGDPVYRLELILEQERTSRDSRRPGSLT
ncbi:hypothetical protein V8E54_006568 [Elaphomyces granulatus]